MKPIMVERAKAQQGARTDIRQISDESKPIRTDEAVTRARACEELEVGQIGPPQVPSRARAREGVETVFPPLSAVPSRARAREVAQ